MRFGHTTTEAGGMLPKAAAAYAAWSADSIRLSDNKTPSYTRVVAVVYAPAPTREPRWTFAHCSV